MKKFFFGIFGMVAPCGGKGGISGAQALAYPAFARQAGIRHNAVNLSAGVRIDGVLHVQDVNAYHSRCKQWLRHFDGVASRYLPNYLGWRWALDANRISSPEMPLR